MTIKDIINRIKGFLNRNKRLPKGASIPEREENKTMEVKESIKDSQFRREVRETAQVSKLDPNRYESKEDLCMGILEDMGLSEEFKKNSRAKEDLMNFVVEIVKKDKKLDELLDFSTKSTLNIRSVDEAKKVQTALKEAGVVIQDNVVRIKEDETELAMGFLDSKYREFRMNGLEYEKGTIDGAVAIASGKIHITTQKSTYSKNGIEMKKDILQYSSQSQHNLTNDDLYNARKELLPHMDMNNDKIIDNSFYKSKADINRTVTQLRRYGIEDILVQYIKGDTTRKGKLFNRTGADLADIDLDAYELKTIQHGSKEELESLNKDISNMEFEKQDGLVNGKLAKTKEILEKINASKYREGFREMAEKEGIIEPEQREE